jgi:hypothetical protein
MPLQPFCLAKRIDSSGEIASDIDSTEAKSTQRKNAAAGVKMVERFLFNRIDRRGRSQSVVEIIQYSPAVLIHAAYTGHPRRDFTAPAASPAPDIVPG